MTLVHYTATPFVFDPTCAYVQLEDWKPRGLWLSVEHDDGSDDDGWADWCRGNEFNTDALKHQTRFLLADDAAVLHLTTSVDIVTFENRYQSRSGHGRGGFPGTGIIGSIDWPKVAREYQGIIIAPYQWRQRMDSMWYYSWDCASGCIWDLRAVRVLQEVP